MTTSVRGTVRMFPNRKAIRSGAYPGVMWMKMIPIATPTAQRMPMNRSFGFSIFSSRRPIRKAAARTKAVAPKRGRIPSQ